MMTSKWHQDQEYSFIHPFRLFKCIRFVEKLFFCHEQREGGGGILDSPFWGSRASWLDQTGIGTCILQNKTIIRPLTHTLRISFFPRRSGLDQNCAWCTTRPCGQQYKTINGYLWTSVLTKQLELRTGRETGKVSATKATMSPKWPGSLSPVQILQLLDNGSRN